MKMVPYNPPVRHKDTLDWPLQDAPIVPSRDPYNYGRWPENAECPLLRAGGRFVKVGRSKRRV